MKINTETVNNPHQQRFRLPRPDGSEWELTLGPLPLGFHRKLRQRGIQIPQVPTKIARDSNGRPVRDAQGMAVVMSDEQNAEYRDELELYYQRVAVLVVAESLKGDATIQFETEPPENADDWRSYADRLYDEMGQAGWTEGDLVCLCNEVCRLSNLLNSHLAGEQKNFSPVSPGGG